MGLMIVLARRLALMLGTMLVVSILVFLLLEYDIDSVAVKVLGPFSTLEQRRIWLEANGYTDPALTRYLRWLGGILQGDFGMSQRFRRPVSEVLWPRLANTALLGAITLAIVSVLGLGLGVLAGVNEGRPLDRVISVLSVVTTSVPEFASAVLLSAVFVFGLGWLPGTSGMAAGFDPWQLVLPVMVLVLYDFGYIARLTRASMAETMRANYVRTARLKGLGHWAVVTTSVPEFASAVLLSAVFVFWLGWLPGTSGMAAGFDPWQLVLPVMVLVLYDFGYIARLTRASMAETMRANYVRTARLKGLGHWAVVTRHALRNALIAPYTVLVLQINWLLSGVIVVEFFFAYKGFGALLLEASLHQDIYLIQACAIVAVFAAVASQAISDVGYVLLNPRMRVA